LLSLTHALLAGSQQVEYKIRSEEGWAERRGGWAVFIYCGSKERSKHAAFVRTGAQVQASTT